MPLSAWAEKLKKIRKSALEPRSDAPTADLLLRYLGSEIALTRMRAGTTFRPCWGSTRLHRKGGDTRTATLGPEIITTQRPLSLTPANQA